MITHYLELLNYLKRTVFYIVFGVIGTACAFSVFFLYITPIYTASNKVVILPTDAELNFARTFVQSGNVNPANLMSQTHIEYMLSRTVSKSVIDKMAELTKSQAQEALATESNSSSWKTSVKRGFRSFKNWVRSSYNILNSGKHVPLDPYTDIILGLQDNIKLEMVEGTYIIEVSVSWDNPEVAALAANLLAESYIELQREQSLIALDRMEAELQEDLKSSAANSGDIREQIRSIRLARSFSIQNLRIIDPAVAPIYPSFPKVVLNTLIAAVASVFLALFYLVFKDTFAGRVISGQDLETHLSGRSFGTLQLRKKSTAKIAKKIYDTFILTGRGQTSPIKVISFSNPQDSVAVTKVLNDQAGNVGEGVPDHFVSLDPAAYNLSNPVNSKVKPAILLVVRPDEFSEAQLLALIDGFETNLNAQVYGLVVKR